MYTATDLLASAQELNFGSQPASVKFALWIAAMSAQQSLEKNGVAARVLAAYVDSELPDRESLYAELCTWGCNVNNNHLNALYHAQELEWNGQLVTLGAYSSPNIIDQLTWRKNAWDLFHPYNETTGKREGKGMAWKTISFALMLLNPLSCQLVPIDRHHLARLGYNKNKGVQNYATYLRIETEIRQEAVKEGLATIPLALFAWKKWEEYRQLTGASTECDKLQSHILLSCRMY